MAKGKVKERKIRTTALRRLAYFDRDTLDKEKRTVELAFSSEEPVGRWFGNEILDHSKKSVRMDRLKKTGPLLLDHNSREHIGTVESARIDTDRVGRAIVRLGRGAERDQILDDIEDGIRKCVSVGYRIHRMKLEEANDDEVDTYRSTDWEPYEVSLVSMPADTTVGVGREAREWQGDDDGERHDTIIVELPEKEDRDMPETAEQKEVREKREKEEREEAARLADKPPADKPEVKAEDIRKAEQDRIRLITEVGAKHNLVELAKKSVEDGDTLAQFHAKLLDELPGAGKRNPETSSLEDNNLGLSDKENKRFSFLKLIRAQAFGDKDERYIKAAEFEIECSREAAKKYDQTPAGYIVPTDVLLFGDRDRTKNWRTLQAFEQLLISQRILTEGVAGASTIAEDLLSGSFIELLRNRSVIMALGATTLDGLQGDVAIPRLTGGGGAFWLATDVTDITESTQTLDQVTLTPKNVGAMSIYTRQLLLQSSIAIEQLVRNDLATVLALAIDLAGLYGTGASGQPLGIANTAGIAAPGAFVAPVPTFAELVAFESSVATNNALLGTLAYAVESAMRGSLKTTEKFTNTGFTVWEPGNTLNGYRTEVTNQITSGDVFYGNWADLLQGVWGGLDVLVDPYTLGARMNTRIIEMWTTDFAVRHPESFAFDNDT